MKLLLGVFLVLFSDIGACANSNKKIKGTSKDSQIVNLSLVKLKHSKLMEVVESKTQAETEYKAENLAVR